MMGTEIFKIDASWPEKLTKTRVQFLLTPTVGEPNAIDFTWYYAGLYLIIQVLSQALP